MVAAIYLETTYIMMDVIYMKTTYVIVAAVYLETTCKCGLEKNMYNHKC